MTNPSLAQPAPPATRELRALELYRYHGEKIEHLYGDVYRVPSQDGARSYDVLYGDREECPCPDYQYRGVNCVHILALGIHHAKHRIHPETAAGDPFAYAGRSSAECPACYRGVVYLTYEEDGHEWTEPTPCRRCQRS